jgi:hypothetical protein
LKLKLYPLTCWFTGLIHPPDCSNSSNSLQLLPVQPQAYLLVLVSIYLLRLNSLLHLLRLHNLLMWHHLPLFQHSVIRTFSNGCFSIALHCDLNDGISEFTSVLNHNTLPTIRNTELIRLSTRLFQRKQFRSQRVCIT